MKKQKIIGSSLLVVCFLGAVFLGGSLHIFVNVPSLIITFGGALGGLLIYKAPHSSKEELIFQFGRFALWSGLIGTLIANVQIMANLNDPKSMGPALAIGMLTVLYGVVTYFICYVLAAEKTNIKGGFRADALSVFLTVFSTGYMWATVRYSLG